MAKEHNFDVWLRDAMEGRPNVFLVRNSGVKASGRPVIDDSRVSKWLKGEQRPSWDLAVLAAETLGRPAEESLEAAGYQLPTTLHAATGSESRDVDLTKASEEALLAELARRAAARRTRRSDRR
ncbi:MAG: hypothetical protein GEU93_03315 [Propionibacteriales bacterium]|nr:hypothetical protein [Propionibacteriales bacterium]